LQTVNIEGADSECDEGSNGKKTRYGKELETERKFIDLAPHGTAEAKVREQNNNPDKVHSRYSGAVHKQKCVFRHVDRQQNRSDHAKT
jgi:hypothetical protein